MPDTVPAPVSHAADAQLEPLPPELTTIQPGGGFVMQLELAWGGVRRWWLKTCRGGYVRRMEALRKGARNPTPHGVLDPRDVKYYENQPGAYRWDSADDPFHWRDRLPFARWGLAELVLMTGLGLALTAAFLFAAQLDDAPTALRYLLLVLALGSAIATGLIVYFFRDPNRDIPRAPGQIVSPADGTVAAVTEYDHHPFIGGPAVKIGIFLSIFNVHVNRFPLTGKVVDVAYKRGKYLNALKPESVLENEQLHVKFITTDEADGPPRKMVIHLIAGLIARRIVCVLKPGDAKRRGDRIGMIKLGSRTELVVPKEDGLRMLARVGDKVHGGTTILAEYASATEDADRHKPHPGPPPIPIS
ncbi:MAG: phosphatidylserine decarboxylase family protein [Planctomycetaceae bacterium]|nr:phosphatidylserine decarboxylase family protein [Planctomycetaceae bacterium]